MNDDLGKLVNKGMLVTAVAAATLAGCAGGGGGGGWESTPIPQPTPTAELRCAWFLPFICAYYEPGAPADEPASEAGFRFSSLGGEERERFASWSSLAPDQAAEFDAIAATSVTKPPEQRMLTNGPRYTAQKELAGGALARIDGLDVSEIGVTANPYAQEWNFQSFGVWNTHGADTRQVSSFSFGAPTPVSAVPSSGTASFAGKLGGFYVSPAGEASVASADVRVNADFGSRSLSFASSGTRLTQDLKAFVPAPHLNLGGTLTYSPAANTFSGALSTAGGSMSGSTTGRYYGPAAQELGGVFAVKSSTTSEALSGAYGAKR